MLPVLVAVVVAAFCLGLALWPAEAAAPAAVAHLVFAVAIMPLILGAMSHFVPVLSRSREPPRGIRRLPWPALAAGALAVGSLGVPAQWRPGVAVASILGLAAASGMAAWTLARGREALGAPHPGLHWYAASCLLLAAALVAALGWAALPQHARELRLIHLHLNVLGFVLPLVTGAISQLLPVWLRPGVQTEWHVRTRQEIGRLGGVRGALFVGGGATVMLGWPAGIWLAAAGMALFLVALWRGLLG